MFKKLLFTKKKRRYKTPKLNSGYLIQNPEGVNLGLYFFPLKEEALKWKEMRSGINTVFKVFFLELDNGRDVNSSYKYLSKEEV